MAPCFNYWLLFLWSKQSFLQDLFLQQKRQISSDKLQEYTDTMVISLLMTLSLMSCCWFKPGREKEISISLSQTAFPHRDTIARLDLKRLFKHVVLHVVYYYGDTLI